MNSMTEVLAELVGKRVMGGCDGCSAYQVLTDEGIGYLVHVFHDDGCQELAQIRRRLWRR